MKVISKAQRDSLNKPVQAAILENAGDTNMTVSGDGALIMRSHSDAYDIAALCSSNTTSQSVGHRFARSVVQNVMVWRVF